MIHELSDLMKTKIGASKYFTWGEALWLPQMQAYAKPTTEQIHNIKLLATHLDVVREYFGRPITVTSWLRPTEYNRLISGALRSAHIDGKAVDFVIKGLDCEFVKKELQANRQVWGYRGEIDTNGWVHLDMMPGGWFYARPKK